MDKKPANPQKILVVEDDSNLQTAIRRAFMALGWAPKVDWATSATEATHLLEHNHYDLFVVDYTLPGMATGMEFWNQCNRKTPLTPFLMISGLGTEEFLRLTKDEAAPPAFLSKPFSLGDFEQAVMRLFTHRPFRLDNKRAA